MPITKQKLTMNEHQTRAFTQSITEACNRIQNRIDALSVITDGPEPQLPETLSKALKQADDVLWAAVNEFGLDK